MKALALVLALAASPAAANCLPTLADMTLRLSTVGERALGLGISDRGPAVVLFAAPSGTWSVVQVTPAGAACLIDYGTAWSVLPDRTGKPA